MVPVAVIDIQDRDEEEGAFIAWANPKLNKVRPTKKRKGRQRPPMAIRKKRKLEQQAETTAETSTRNPALPSETREMSLGTQKAIGTSNAADKSVNVNKSSVTSAEEAKSDEGETCRVYKISTRNHPMKKSVILHSLLKTTTEGDSFKIEWQDRSRLTLDMCKWRKIKRTYGDSSVLSPATLQGPLKERIEHLQHSRKMSIIVRIHKAKDPIGDTLTKILKCPNASYPALNALDLGELLRLLTRVNSTERITPKLKQVAGIIQKILKKNFGVPRIPNIVMRVPYYPGLQTRPYRRAFMFALEATEIHEEVKQVLRENLRIVETKRRSVSQMLHNYRAANKEHKHGIKPECVCLRTEYAILLPETDLPAADKEVIFQNSKNIAVLENIDLHKEGRGALRKVIETLEKLEASPGLTKNLSKDSRKCKKSTNA